MGRLGRDAHDASRPYAEILNESVRDDIRSVADATI